MQTVEPEDPPVPAQDTIVELLGQIPEPCRDERCTANRSREILAFLHQL